MAIKKNSFFMSKPPECPVRIHGKLYLLKRLLVVFKEFGR